MRPNLVLAAVLGGLLATSSVVGLLFGWSGLYGSYSAQLAGLVGQDIVTLMVGLPVLIGLAWLARRKSRMALLAWAGALFYFAYSYFFFVIGGFNALFVVYVAIVAASLYGLLALLIRLESTGEARYVREGLPRRAVATFFAVSVALFALMWGGMSLAAAAAGEVLDPVPHLVVAIDGTVLLPALAIAAFRLWRKQTWGDALGGLLLVKVVLTGLTLAFSQALGMAWAGRIDGFEAFLFAIFAVMAVIGVGLLIPYARSYEHPMQTVEPAPQASAASAAARS